MTPYQYVSNNPIMRIDPTGMNDHDYKLNKDGSLEKTRHTKDNFDRIFNEEGTESITVSKGFMNGSEKENNMFEHKRPNPNYGKADIYNVSNAEVKSGKGKNIFNFFARNTRVEYDYNEFSNTKTGGRFGTLQTTHKSGKVEGVQELVSSILDISSDIRWDYSVHNHPDADTIKSFYPSGWEHNGLGGYRLTRDYITKEPFGDRGVFDAFKSNPKYNNRMPKYHHVISPFLNKTIKYDNKNFYRIN